MSNLYERIMSQMSMYDIELSEADIKKVLEKAGPEYNHEQL